jgi:hypothetical protein
MLITRFIPNNFDDDHLDDWHTFLSKAAKGSIKAVETLDDASMSYMMAFTGDPTSPDTWKLTDYFALLRKRFPTTPPVACAQELHDMAVANDWLARPFRMSESAQNPPEHYCALWGRRPVKASALMHDAILLCLAQWSADHMIECVEHRDTQYDARIVTAGMLYLSLTWPNQPMA